MYSILGRRSDETEVETQQEQYEVNGGAEAAAFRHLGRPVIKAFNNIYARHLLELGRPKGATGRIALPVAVPRSSSSS